jgi:hypothetical protein
MTDSLPSNDRVIATFKTTRIINMQSIESLPKRTLNFVIAHRFGAFNSGSYNFWGLDGPASIRIGLEYSYDGRFMMGIGRSSDQKMMDGFLKYRIIRQTTTNSSPISMTAVSAMNYTLQVDPNAATTGFNEYQYPTNRMSFVNELIFGRKFNQKLSLQMTAYMVHVNQVQYITDHNDIFAAGIAGRYKLSKRMALTAEYVYRINKYSVQTYYNPFGIGFDIETGGHVFQIMMVNSYDISEAQVIPYTNTKWTNMGIRLGFNLSRVFSL